MALTIPRWIGTRWESKGLRVAFSGLSLGLLAFAALIVVAPSLVLSRLLGVPAEMVAAGILLYVLLATWGLLASWAVLGASLLLQGRREG